MTTTPPQTVHVAVYDTFADWEVGHLTAHLQVPSWQKQPGRYVVRYVGVDREPVTSLGGLTILPDLALADLSPEDSAMLVLPGNDLWPDERFTPFAEAARAFLAAGVPVAAICGATGGLALAGLLDDRAHTSNAREFLAGTGYAGGDLYRDEPAVADRGLVTGSGVAPVDFARAALEVLDVYDPHVLASWTKLFGRQDPAGYAELTAVGA